LTWYEFDILPAEKTFYADRYGDLLGEYNDPSAGFLRYYITVYVEAFGKLSPDLTAWLLDKQHDRRRIRSPPTATWSRP
jgi:hypothetical protein